MAVAPPSTRGSVVECDGIVEGDGVSTCFVRLDLDPVAVFGRVRAPVRATVGAAEFRTTICRMGGVVAIPLRRSNRQVCGVEPGQRLRVMLTLDEQERTVETPADLARALRAGGVFTVFEAMSFTHRREWVEAVEGAKRPETRAKRLAACVLAMRERGAEVAKKVRKVGGRGGKQGARG